jgi:light-regulated signal transduction histidine kinase (bacteriophytochrome)
MGQLIDALLQLSRLSRADMHVATVDLSGQARDILAELQEQEPGRSVETAVADGVKASGDPALLGIALQNLLGNAWKFTARQPRARVEFGMATAPDGGAAYVVRDNGAGFDMAFADRLFGAFQRLHSDSEFPGMGIGLATVQRIVHRHGGRIWAESKPGKGSSFYFTLKRGP